MLAGSALIAYPVLVWFGLTHGSPRSFALAMLCVLLPLAAIRMRSSARGALRGLAAVPLVAVAALVLAAALDRSGFVLAVPVAINGLLLIAFGATLRRDSTPMVERMARLQESDLTPAQQAWCRLWTRIWCVFFVLNGGTALVLALAAPLSWWTVYNGLIAYVLMGVLFATEWILRRRLVNPAGTGPGARSDADERPGRDAGQPQPRLGGARREPSRGPADPGLPHADP